MVLARTRAERERDVAPGVEVGSRGRQMQHDAAHGDDHVDAQFEQPLAQPRHLGARTRGARSPQAEFLHEDVRGGREEHAQLIGPEATAARSSDLEPVVQFLDPIFDVAAGAVDALVDEPGRLPNFVMTKRALSRGARPSSRTTSALITTRRSCRQVPAA